MKKIFLILLVCTSFLSASINECLSDVYFANGIDTTYKQAKKSKNELRDTIKLSHSETLKSINDWNISYNHTHGIGIDLYESMLQKIDEHWYTEYVLDVSGLLDYSWKGLAKMVAKKVAKEKIKEQSKKYASKIAKKLVGKYGNVYKGKHFTEEEITAIFELGFNNLTFAPKPKHFLSDILQHSDDAH